MKSRTRRSLLAGGIAAVAGGGAWEWLHSRDDWRDRPTRLIGLDQDFDPSTWKLSIVGLPHNWPAEVAGEEMGEPALSFNLEDIQLLPRVEIVAALNCLDAPHEAVRWAGARFSDFLIKFHLGTRSGEPPDSAGRPEDLTRYVALETPGKGYYVGLEMAMALHPRTLLCYEREGQPLTLEHGAPLRLIAPAEHGLKSIKRIGVIRFTDQLPADYWAERGRA